LYTFNISGKLKSALFLPCRTTSLSIKSDRVAENVAAESDYSLQSEGSGPLSIPRNPQRKPAPGSSGTADGFQR
jgi:hypothetical protein